MLKLIRELYSVRIRIDPNFFVFFVLFFVTDFILPEASSDLSNSCCELKFFFTMFFHLLAFLI